MRHRVMRTTTPVGKCRQRQTAAILHSKRSRVLPQHALVQIFLAIQFRFLQLPHQPKLSLDFVQPSALLVAGLLWRIHAPVALCLLCPQSSLKIRSCSLQLAKETPRHTTPEERLRIAWICMQHPPTQGYHLLQLLLSFRRRIYICIAYHGCIGRGTWLGNCIQPPLLSATTVAVVGTVGTIAVAGTAIRRIFGMVWRHTAA